MINSYIICTKFSCPENLHVKVYGCKIFSNCGMSVLVINEFVFSRQCKSTNWHDIHPLAVTLPTMNCIGIASIVKKVREKVLKEEQCY